MFGDYKVLMNTHHLSRMATATPHRSCSASTCPVPQFYLPPRKKATAMAFYFYNGSVPGCVRLKDINTYAGCSIEADVRASDVLVGHKYECPAPAPPFQKREGISGISFPSLQPLDWLACGAFSNFPNAFKSLTS